MRVSEGGALPRAREVSRARPRAAYVVCFLLFVALVARLAFIGVTSEYELRHDASDYDRHARSIASGHGYPDAAAPGRPTAYRPPGFPYLLGAVYKLAGVERSEASERARAGRIAEALLGTVAVGLTGLLAHRLWGRRVALVALGLGALYVPLIVDGGALLSEPLFVVFVLGALLAALEQRRSSHRYRWAVAAGVLTGLASLTRSNGVILLIPLALAAWGPPPRISWKAVAAPAVLAAAAILTIAPWTVRNALTFHSFVPIGTQGGAALAGTYNEAARHDREDPASWRVLRLVPDYARIYARKSRTPEPVLDRQLRAAALRYIGRHPLYVLEVGFWNTVRALDLAGLDRTRSTVEATGLDSGWGDAEAICFWIVAGSALFGAAAGLARNTPWQVWAVPLLLFLTVAFLNVETPRFRAPLEPFIIVLAALTLTAACERRDRAASARLSART
jgi:4-amino-4-deoxy-L-arabinose transferase-like glycosyltransferase